MLVRFITTGILAFLITSLSRAGEIHTAVSSGTLAMLKSVIATNPLAFREQTTDFYKNTPLHLAAKVGHTNVLDYLLSLPLTKSDIEKTNSNGWTAMHLAVDNGRTAAMELLIKAKAQLSAEPYVGNTPLHLAARWGHIDTVKALLQHGVPLEARNISFYTPLYEAVRGNQPETVQLLIDYGANVNCVDYGNSTPLVRAAVGGNLKLVQILLAKGANINASTDDGYSALYLAVRERRTNCVQFLLEKGANLDIEDNYGLTALGWCLENPSELHSKFMSELLGAKGATKTGSRRKQTNIFTASGTGDLERVKELISESPELIRFKNYEGRTPLHAAASRGVVPIVKYLIDKGADINAIDDVGVPPLHAAAQSGSLETVKLVVGGGANIRAVDASKQTALHRAVFGGNRDVFKLLISTGLDPDTKDADGRSALDIFRSFLPQKTTGQ